MMRRRPGIRSALAILGAGLVVGGVSSCAATGGSGSSATTPPAPDQIATYRTDGVGGGFQALNQGTLVLDDGCLYTGSATYETDGSALTLMVFPEELTSWDGTTLTVGEESWRVGETVDLGGGMVSEPTSPSTLSPSLTVPDSCATDRVWLVSAEY